MEKHTHITRWNDGEADWEMVIQDGRVTVKTSGDATKADAADELSQQWSALMGFAVAGESSLIRIKEGGRK